MNQEDYHVLYEDETGKLLGLYEMQLLESPLPGRVDELKKRLGSSEESVAFQAALILTAWGENSGVTYFEQLLPTWPALGKGLFPHRIYDYDNALDEIAYAAHSYSIVSSDHLRVKNLFRQLLQHYGPANFESRLKSALLNLRDCDLLKDVETAVQRAEKLGKYYLASQLLPVVAKCRGNEALPLVRRFLELKDEPNPRVNVAESLRFIHSNEAAAMLKDLAMDPDPIVADEANGSIRSSEGKK